MSTRCTDISENRRLNQASPVATFAFVAIFIVLTVLLPPGIPYLICLAVAYILCQVLFFYKPRFVFLTMRFLFTNSYLTPSIDDQDFLADERQIEGLGALIKGKGNATELGQAAAGGIAHLRRP